LVVAPDRAPISGRVEVLLCNLHEVVVVVAKVSKMGLYRTAAGGHSEDIKAFLVAALDELTGWFLVGGEKIL
jgi:hypothetical protein